MGILDIYPGFQNGISEGIFILHEVFHLTLVVKTPPANAGVARSNTGLGKSPGIGSGNPFQ